MALTVESVRSTLTDDELSELERNARSAQQIADKIHDLIQRSGGPHVGAGLDVHTVEVLIRGLYAEQTLRLIATVRDLQSQVSRPVP